MQALLRMHKCPSTSPTLRTLLPLARAPLQEFEIVNVDRSALGRVGGAVARKYGDSGFTGRLQLLLRGSAGQSFACFVVGGMDVKLVGEANDYVGKGMAGGDVTIVPPPGEPSPLA